MTSPSPGLVKWHQKVLKLKGSLVNFRTPSASIGAESVTSQAALRGHREAFRKL